MTELVPPELVAAELRTERLLLRRWRPEDASPLHDALAPSVAHLKPWIPWTVAEPAPVPQLEARLARFAEAIAERRAWQWGIFAADTGALLGGISLHPRDAHTRVPFDAADRVEIGYWLRVDATGQGYATEAVRAVLAVARALPHVSHVEIRCDARNAPSAAIPRRLGFRHARTLDQLMVWEHPA
ncbi:GNAT family N-acetyltransferase [Roseisolibacter agri]|uniref:Acetyltransferase n=1 Tax=Roseisolibacter agri TaxID=2014610 RepID=A0AA37VE67_9BACT|nr:GNAT family N-acetyltransferase [Roseisolibacter agri]GLC24689.1 putative acetyltransferase [Roseisolibacter agri]